MLALFTVLVLTACSGGGGSDGTEISPQQAAMNKIMAWANTDGASSSPALQDYVAIGITSDLSINAMNSYILRLNKDDVNTSQKVKDIATHFGTTIIDTDGDGVPNELDGDDDNDGISDIDEIAAGTDPLDPSSGENFPPVANADIHRVIQNSPTSSISVLANDTDANGDTLFIKEGSVTAPDNGGTAIISGTEIHYTPATDFTGIETFNYAINDGTIDSSTTTVTVIVTLMSGENFPPVANADIHEVIQNSPTSSISVLANDTDANGDTLFIKEGSVTAPDNGGTAIISGTEIHYTPATDFNGTETFSYIVSDGLLESNATVTVTLLTPPMQSHKGLIFYHDNLPATQYRLNQLTDDEFNLLSDSQKLTVSNKLLNTLFFAYPLKELKEKINSGNFLTAIKSGLDTETTDRAWLESYILDDRYFKQYTSRQHVPQTLVILSRFYAMQDLDKYFFHNWVAYILTQTIMFSPASELLSTHTPNIANIYTNLVTMLENKSGMRFITYTHMSSQENWRRFRSPEDNGREMLEIYLFDFNDSNVPLAAQALQNWRLNSDGNTLEVGLNRNTEPLSLFNTTVYSGDDFYVELVKSEAFTRGVTRRLVDFFFPKKSTSERENISNAIISSEPETWQDILLQIIFSEEYLLRNNRPQGAEETFYSLAKKINFRHRTYTFRYFRDALVRMQQATMKYKLGKLNRVPLDALSFAEYHKYIRQEVMFRRANPETTDTSHWNYRGWQDSFIGFDKFEHDETDDATSLKNFVDYLFEATIARKAKTDEHNLFKGHMIRAVEGVEVFYGHFDMFTIRTTDQDKKREEHKRNIAYIVLDYISRLEELYKQKGIN